jgi:nicotinamide phosphoribosyltransferase
MAQPFVQTVPIKTDSYKLTHWWQYPPDTQYVYSHLMARGGFWNHTLFSGIQGILKQHFTGEVLTLSDIKKAEKFCFQHFGSDKVFNPAWYRLLDKHKGRLPLRIKAVPEGTLVPTKNVLMTIENTDPEFPWITNWAETMLLQVWYPITVGTLSFEIKQAIGKDLVRTGTPAGLPFKLHDFGYRGVSSVMSAAIGGAAHLINFKGTDTIAAIEYLQQYYGADMPGFSIPAMEHSTVTTWGEENEEASYRNMLEKSPTPMVACVIDSYDPHRAMADLFGGTMKDMVLRREGVVVLRPDSGDPTVVLEDIFNTIAQKVGGVEANAKGWKVLPVQLRAIQGDGVNYQNILRINSHLIRAGWSMDNWGYGMGGALLQQQNRDTLGFYIKCSAVNRAGVWRDVYKTTKADPSKSSRGGRFSLVDIGDGQLVTVTYTNEAEYGDILRTVLEDGNLLVDETHDAIVARAATYDRFAA